MSSNERRGRSLIKTEQQRKKSNFTSWCYMVGCLMFSLFCYLFSIYLIFSVDNLGAMAYRGDLIACEVDFSGVPEGKVSVLFSLNGRKVARSSVEYTEGNKLFPFVSLGFEGITVLTKVCSKEGGGSGEGNGLEIESINGLVSSVICQHIIPRHTPPATINRGVVPVTKLKAC